MQDAHTKDAEKKPLGHVLDSREGTVEFVLEIPESLHSGLDVERSSYSLFELPGLAQVELRSAPSGWDLWWIWETKTPFYHILQGFPNWPAGSYHIQYTWKADEGLLQLFINGTPTRVPEARFTTPWTHEDRAESVVLRGGEFNVSQFRSSPQYTSANELRDRVAPEHLGQHAELFWDFADPEDPLDKAGFDLKLLYESDLSSPDLVEGWLMEGPGVIEFSDGWMTMRSTRPDAPPGVNGHIVYWFPEPLPDSFVAEWEVQLLNDPGLLIVFFAAMGLEGESLFDGQLPERDGTFGHYVNGAIRCYHISYYSNPSHEPGRTTSNMRKNPPAMMVQQGPVGIPAASDAIHQVQLIKKGKDVQLSVDGEIAIRWTDDDPERYGPFYGEGFLGFRQMQWTQARYQNLKIHEILDQAKCLSTVPQG